MKSKKINRQYIFTATLLLYGLVCAFILVFPKWNVIGNGWISKFRCERLTVRYNTLIGGADSFEFSRVTHTLGYPLYFPYIMKWFSISDGAKMFNIAQTFGGMSVIFLYPLLVFKMTNSYLAALLSPFVVHLLLGMYCILINAQSIGGVFGV